MTTTQTSDPGVAHADAAPSLVTTGALAAVLAERLGGAKLIGRDDLPITGVSPLERAGEGDLSFIRSQRHASRWAESSASAALVTQGVDVPDHDADARALIVVPSADLAMIALLEQFKPPAPDRVAGVHPSAVIDPSAQIDPSAHIGPLCTIDAGAKIGADTTLIARVHVGVGASVGAHSTLHPGVVLGDRCVVGHHCALHANVAVGADGFGYVPHPETKLPVKVPHIGAVRIGDHVEMGAGSTVDRGKLDDTIIGHHVKLDNMVQIAHNCRVGDATIICALTGVAGSVTIGRGCVIGAQTGIADNVTIGDNCQFAAKTGIMRDIPDGQIAGGVPSEPGAFWLKAHAAIKKLQPHAGALQRLAQEQGKAPCE